MRRIGWSHAHLLRRAYEMGCEKTSGRGEFLDIELAAEAFVFSKVSPDLRAVAHGTLHRLADAIPAASLADAM